MCNNAAGRLIEKEMIITGSGQFAALDTRLVTTLPGGNPNPRDPVARYHENAQNHVVAQSLLFLQYES
jgi:hypothetical protein